MKWTHLKIRLTWWFDFHLWHSQSIGNLLDFVWSDCDRHDTVKDWFVLLNNRVDRIKMDFLRISNLRQFVSQVAANPCSCFWYAVFATSIGRWQYAKKKRISLDSYFVAQDSCSMLPSKWLLPMVAGKICSPIQIQQWCICEAIDRAILPFLLPVTWYDLNMCQQYNFY